MKELVNLIFANTERLLWFRHLLWTLRKTDNEPCGIGYYSNKHFDVINEDTQKWLYQHRNDYLDTGKTTGTENSTDAPDEVSRSISFTVPTEMPASLLMDRQSFLFMFPDSFSCFTAWAQLL